MVVSSVGYISNMVGIFKRQELLTLRVHLSSSPVFGGVRVVHLSIFLCCGFCFVFLRPVSCIPNVASCFLDCLFLMAPSVCSKVYINNVFISFEKHFEK